MTPVKFPGRHNGYPTMRELDHSCKLPLYHQIISCIFMPLLAQFNSPCAVTRVQLSEDLSKWAP